MTFKILHLIHGPNLNLLGTREPAIYGFQTLKDIEQELQAQARKFGLDLVCIQSNHEGNLLDYIHQCPQKSKAIINAGAFAHTSLALRDALLAKEFIFAEVHLSNTRAREAFRSFSYLEDISAFSVYGKGFSGYVEALEFLTRPNFS